MNALEVLKATRELLSDPARWTQGVYARVGDEQCDELNPFASCFCLSGAFWRFGADEIHPARLRLSGVLGVTNLIAWNDAPERTHNEVLAALDKAIALAEQEQS
jgi:hypothetical protein